MQILNIKALEYNALYKADAHPVDVYFRMKLAGKI